MKNFESVPIANRIKEAMARSGLRQVDILEKSRPLCDALGVTITKGLLSQYIHGKCEPSRTRIFILAQIFGVSEAWLMGLDVPMIKEPDAAASAGVASAMRDARLLELFSRLNQSQQAQVLKYIEFLLASANN